MPSDPPLSPYPTLESVGMEILGGIVWKIVSAGREDGYLNLEHRYVIIDLHVHLTDEEVDVMRRMAALIDGSETPCP